MLSAYYRWNPGDITIRNHYTRERLRLHSYKHKGYLFHGKRREQAVMQWFARVIRAGDTVIEVGGHIGYVTQYLARLVGDGGYVYVFEPARNNLPYIRANIEGRKHVALIEAAAGNASERRLLYTEDITGLNNSFCKSFTQERLASNAEEASASELNVQAIQVDVWSLDDFVAASRIRPNLIKIDVEGFELEVLCGASSILGEYRPILMLEVQPDHGEDAWRLLSELGYIVVLPEQRRVVESANEVQGNTFCFHREAHRHVLRAML